MIQYRGRCYVSWKDGAGSLSTTKYVDLLQSNQSSANYTFRNNLISVLFINISLCVCVWTYLSDVIETQEKRGRHPLGPVLETVMLCKESFFVLF